MSKVKLTFYPMAGGVTGQFQNLVRTLQWIESNNPTSMQIQEWLKNTFGLSYYFSRDVYSVLLISSGLVKLHQNKSFLTTKGKLVLKTGSESILLEVFETSFAGVAAFLEVLRSHHQINSEKLKSLWFEKVIDRFPIMRKWSAKTLGNQCRHRIDWLRAMGFISVENKLFSLSESGTQFVIQHPPEAIGIQRVEITSEEKKLAHLLTSTFQPFDIAAEKVQSLRQSFVRDKAFRHIVSSQYDFVCAVCGFRLKAPRGVFESEAAHIVPKHQRGTDDPRNGLCLCRTCHWSFDEGIISVSSKDLLILTASFILEENKDSTSERFSRLQNRRIRKVKDQRFAPSEEALDWHNNQIFLR